MGKLDTPWATAPIRLLPVAGGASAVRLDISVSGDAFFFLFRLDISVAGDTSAVRLDISVAGNTSAVRLDISVAGDAFSVLGRISQLLGILLLL